jgi:pilus assembly protein CpaE
MYPLKVIMVGCKEEDVGEIQQHLLNQAVEIEAEYSDVKAAVASLTLAKEEKRLFVLQVQSDGDLRQLERLNETFSGRPILAILRQEWLTQDTALRAMRAGAAQVVGLPLGFADFKAALDRIAKQFGYAFRESKVISVSGVSEGCGATTVAMNVAYEVASRHELTCILAEMSWQIGRLAVQMNLEPRFTTPDLLSDMEHFDINAVRQALVPVGDRLSVLCGPFRSITPLVVSPTDVLRLVECLRRLADVVVLDMPYTYDEVYFRVLGAADEIVLVAEQKLSSVHGLMAVREALNRQEHPGTQFLVINRYNSYLKELDVSYLKELLKVERIATIANDTEGIKAASKSGKPLRMQVRHSPVLDGIAQLTDRLLGLETHENGMRGMFHKVAQAVGLEHA